jgi:glycogen operon protein
MLIALRKRHFQLSNHDFVNRVRWHGLAPHEPDWSGVSRTLAFELPGQPDFYILLNAHWESRAFRLRSHGGQWRWRRLLDTNLPSPQDIVEEKDAVPLNPGDQYIVSPRSAVILVG